MTGQYFYDLTLILLLFLKCEVSQKKSHYRVLAELTVHGKYVYIVVPIK